jgi:hypothetical protein
MKGAPSQQGGGFGQTGGSSGMPAWLGMAQSYFPQYFGGGGGGAPGYMPQGGTGGNMAPGASAPNTQTLGQPMTAPPTGATPDPFSGAPQGVGGGLLGASAPDASGVQYGHGLMSNTQGTAAPGQWYNRGYGVPGVSAPGQMPPSQQTGFMGVPYGLFGGGY